MTSESVRNEGVVISGNASVSGPIAGGTHARAEQHIRHGEAGASDAIRRELAALRALVRQHCAELDEPDWIVRDLDEVEVETAAPRPDRDRITATLQRIGGRVAGVAAIATAVTQLRDMVLG